MDQQTNQPQNPMNHLEFWVAYQQNGKKRNYLSDGKGHLRVFKSEAALRAYLKPLLTPEQMARTVIHSVGGQIAIPEPTKQPVQVISSMMPPTMPSAMELLNNYKSRKRARKK